MATTAEILVEKKALLAEYLLAEVAILKGQNYSIKDRSLERADLRDVVAAKKNLEQEIFLLETGGIKVKLGVPRST